VSLIDTLAPVILAVGFTAAVLMIVGAWAYRAIVAARLQHLDASHDRLCETRSRTLVRDLVAAVETDPILKDAMPQDLQDRAWQLHDSYTTTRPRELHP
jgi:hypothetical protein